DVEERPLIDRPVLGLGHRQPAGADAEVEGLVEVRVLLLEDVAAGDAEGGGAVLDVGGDVGGADGEDAEGGDGVDELPGLAEGGGEVEPGAGKQGDRLLVDAALGHGEDDRLGAAHSSPATWTRFTRAPSLESLRSIFS